MNWEDFQRTELASLRGLLRQHCTELSEARLVWLRVGRAPDDPLVVELDRTLRQTETAGCLVADEILALAPGRSLPVLEGVGV